MTIASTRLLLTIPFGVPAYWTPEQALAVVELLDELHRHREPQSCDPSGSPPDDPLF